MTDLRCINQSDECAGPVEYRTTSDRADGKHFARCVFHHDKRQVSAERSLELDRRPVDPSYAGERYEEDE